MHIIIGIPPIIIIMGMPMFMAPIIMSQRSFIIFIMEASLGIIFMVMPSAVISQDILHIIGIIMPFMPIMPFIMFGIIIGIIMPFMPFIIIGIIMFGIMPFIIGIMLFIGIWPIGMLIAFMRRTLRLPLGHLQACTA